LSLSDSGFMYNCIYGKTNEKWFLIFRKVQNHIKMINQAVYFMYIIDPQSLLISKLLLAPQQEGQHHSVWSFNYPQTKTRYKYNIHEEKHPQSSSIDQQTTTEYDIFIVIEKNNSYYLTV
ncbi:hypothetical protein ACJX0J_010197, partial [Zea mays]